MKKAFLIICFIPLTFLGQNTSHSIKTELQQLNEALFSEYALKHNTAPLNKTATDDFVLIAAPGMIENKHKQ